MVEHAPTEDTSAMGDVDPVVGVRFAHRVPGRSRACMVVIRGSLAGLWLVV